MESISDILERIMDSLDNPFELGPDNTSICATCSIGVSIFPNDGDDLETLFKNADLAMYSAKEEGKNAYHFFNPVMEKTARHFLEVEEHLRKEIGRAHV